MLGQPAAAKQVGLGSLRLFPIAHCDRESAAQHQLLAVAVDPVLQSRPLPQQRLVGHLDGGAPRDLVEVEGEQPMIAESAQHLVDTLGVETQADQL